MSTTRPIFPTKPPPFKTARLLIRPYQLSDASDFFLLRSQPEVMKWTSSLVPDSDIDRTIQWMAKGLPPQNTTTFKFSIEELANPGRVIGTVASHVPEPPECGYMFRKEYWGAGYATEALKGWLQVYWALPRKEVRLEDGQDGSDHRADEIETLLATVADNNSGSRRVLAKCGFVQDGAVEEDDEILLRYVLRRPS